MDLSSPKLRKILVGVAIFVVVVFIVIRFFRRSNYAYPNASEEGVFSITAIPTFTPAVPGTSPPLATFTTTAAHGFSANQLIYLSGFGNITYTEPVSSLPAGSSTLQGGTAVYIYSVGTGADPTTFTVKATNVAPTLSGVSAIAVPTSTGWTAGPVTITQGSSTTTTGTATITSGKITAVTGIPAGVTGFTAGQVTITQGSLNTTGTATLGAVPAVSVNSGSVKAVAQPGMDKVKNTDLLTCQTNYATDLVSAAYTLTGSSPQTISSAGTKLVTVNSSTGFAQGDKVLIPGVLDAAGKAAVLEVASVATSPHSITFTAGSVPATSQTILPQTAVSNITTAYANRTKCIQQSASAFTTGHCRYLPQADTNRPFIPLMSDDPAAYSAYQQYQQDIQTIQTAYTGPLSKATQNSTFPSTGTVGGTALSQADQQKIIEAARKADLANATQKYLATVCPGFYAQTSAGVTSDPSEQYKAWATVTSDPTSGGTVTVPTTAKKFWAGGVTDTSIMTWAQGAGLVTLSGPVLSVTIPNTGIGSGYTSAPTVIFTAPPTGGTTASGTATVSNGKITGVTIASGGGGSGYTTNPTITFSGGGGTTTSAELAAITVALSTSLSATGPLIPTATTSFTVSGSGGAVTTYSANKYTFGTGDNVNWRIAYKNGPGTYPKQTYATS